MGIQHYLGMLCCHVKAVPSDPQDAQRIHTVLMPVCQLFQDACAFGKQRHVLSRLLAAACTRTGEGVTVSESDDTCDKHIRLRIRLDSKPSGQTCPKELGPALRSLFELP
jgi:hypothetical protein